MLDPLQAAKTMVGAFPWTPDILSMVREVALHKPAQLGPHVPLLPTTEPGEGAAGLQLPLSGWDQLLAGDL